MKKYILLVVLSFLAVSGFADTISTTQHTSVFGLGCAGAPFACTLLGKVFGNISPLYAHDGVLNQVMQVINVALCAFIGLYCGYASVSSVHEILKGGLQNAQMQLAMPFFRLALSTSLLIPIPGSGYSSYQTIVMNVAVAGADLANQVWNTAVQSIVSGLRISPMTNGEQQSFTSNSSSSQQNNIAGLYNTTNGTPYDGSSGGLAAVQNYSYVESLFNHALCYQEQVAASQLTANQSGVNSGSGFVADNVDTPTGVVSIDSDNHFLKIPTLVTSGSSISSPCLQGGEKIATDDQKNYYIQFSTVPSGYAGSGNQVVLAASDNMALNIYSMMDTLAQQVVSYQQRHPNEADLFGSILTPSVPAPVPAYATSVDAKVLGTNLGVQLAKAELSYVQTMQDIIFPAAENSVETRSDGGGSSGDDAALSLQGFRTLLPSNSSLQTTIEGNPMASFISAGTFFFQLATVNEKVDTNAGVIQSSARKTNLANTGGQGSSYYPLPTDNYIAEQYHSFLFNIIGSADLGLSTGSGCSGNTCLFHLSYASKDAADSALAGATTDSVYTISAVNNASSILDANSQLVTSLTGQQKNADTFNTGSQNFSNQVENLTTAIIPFAGDMMGIIADFGLKTPNPWEYVQNIGSNLVGFALGIIIIPPLILGMLELPLGGGMVNCFAGVKALVDKISGSIRPLMMAIGCMSLVSGLILLFLVPMTPYIMYTLGIIGWIFLVVESVVAAPLVAILVSHPEGHHFWGKSEVALTLLLNLFIYPTLLVLGLIISIALVYVSLNLVNLTFAAAMFNTHFNMLNADSQNVAINMSNLGLNTASSIATTTSDKSSAFGLVAEILMSSSTNAANNAALMTMPILGVGGLFIKAMAALLSIPVVVVLYTSIVMMVVKQCSNLIFILPSKVSRWIGVQGEQSDVAQQVQGLGQEVEKKGQPISRFNLSDGKTKGEDKKSSGKNGSGTDEMSHSGSESSDKK